MCKNAIAIFSQGAIKGNVLFHQCSYNRKTKITFDLRGFKPEKEHACHIHEYGDLRQGCKSLGGHLNLENTTHGTIFVDINRSHTGDLVNNIISDAKGNVKFSYTDPRLSLFGDVEKTIYGCSVVIHDGVDDYGLGNNKESLITGNAGSRLACAIIGKTADGETK